MNAFKSVFGSIFGCFGAFIAIVATLVVLVGIVCLIGMGCEWIAAKMKKNRKA